MPGRDSSRPLSRGPPSADTSVGAARKSACATARCVTVLCESHQVHFIVQSTLRSVKPHNGSPTRKEYFIAGTEPKGESSAYQNQKVCKNNPHRLANDNEDNDQKDVVILKEDDPTGANKWQKGIDEWVLTAADPRLVGGSRGCSGVPGFSTGSGAIIEIVNVSNGANVPHVFDVLAKANSPAGVKKITWVLDGAQKSTQTAEPFALHVEFPKEDKGSHTITVTLEDNNGANFSTSIGVTVAL